MRYIVALQALGRVWEGMMRGKGVREETIDGWAAYYQQLTVHLATCSVKELDTAAARIAQSFKTAMYYMEEAGGS